jgi:hypothetical protein
MQETKPLTKAQLEAAEAAVKAETREALHLVYDALKQGQQKKIVKDDRVRALFDLYGVEYD